MRRVKQSGIPWKWMIIPALILAAVMPPHARAAEEPAPPPAAAALEPLTLEQAVATGLALNPRVREADANLRAAQATVTRAEAARSVTADVQVTNTHVSNVPELFFPVPAPPPQFLTFEKIEVTRAQQTTGTVTIAQPLYTGGQIPAAIRQTRAGESASSQQLRRTVQSVANDVKQAYYAVLLGADLVRVAQEALDAAREHLRVAQAHFDAGTAPRFDVLRAETRVAQSEQQLIQARNGLDLARAALDNTMGVPQGREYDLTTSFAAPGAPAPPLEELLEQADAARSEIGQVRAQVAASGAAADLARSERHPTLGIAAIYNRVLDATAFQVSNWTFALQAQLTIFNGEQTSAAVAQARRQQDSARALLEQVRQGIALEVRQAFLNISSARERIAAAAKGVEQAEEAYRIAIVRYNAGVSISVEVIDAQVALSAARTDYSRAVYDHNVALAQLEYAVGAWEPAQEQRASKPVPQTEKSSS